MKFDPVEWFGERMCVGDAFESEETFSLALAAEMCDAATAFERGECIEAIRQADDCECGVPCDCFGSASAIRAIKNRESK